MCGITGFIDYTHKSGQKILRRMTDRLAHRGPDSSGYELYTTERAMLGLGHRRLSIIDLSCEGHQPMHSASNRYVLCLNGEIYNFQDLRAELESLGQAPGWRGHSDTEVLLAAIECWGLKVALQKCIGMFALALWDKKEKRLYLARDRMGEKPLYYGWQGQTFVFGSELKALQEHPDWRGEIDKGVLSLYMRYAYVPAPYSIYKGIYKLEQGTIISLSEPGCREQELCQDTYWSLYDAVQEGIRRPFQGNAQEAVDELERLLLEAVGKQMLADVPLGAFLSGGYDSSTITALMQAQSTKPVKTFSIGFYEDDYNEAHHAKAVAEHLGTEHTEMYVSPKEAMDVISYMPELYDEPFADVSQIPTYLLSKMTREYVTVALSGDGGDELMRGYSQYDHALGLWNVLKDLPYSLCRELAGSITFSADQDLDTDLARINKFLLENRATDRLSQRLTKEEATRRPNFVYFYRHFISKWKDHQKVVINGAEPPSIFDKVAPNGNFFNEERALLYLDAMTYLPDDILVKVDRAAMGASLETRIPLLDHRVVEFIWSLPQRFCWKNGSSKWILRQVLYRYVPRDLVDRPKQGFSVSIGDWLRGPLFSWANACLACDQIKNQGMIEPGVVHRTWQDHINGAFENQARLWTVLMAKKFLY